jgi:hypothetical protein
VTASYAGFGDFLASSSRILTQTITAPVASVPIFSPAEGTYDAGQAVTLTSATKGAVIHYTTNGKTPTATSTKYSAPIRLTQTTIIQAIATATGYADSSVSSATYTIRPPAPTPTFTPKAGAVASGQIVKIADTATKGLVIYYTTNGEMPTNKSTRYTSAGIRVTTAETIRAIAVANGDSPSVVASAKYAIQ